MNINLCLLLLLNGKRKMKNQVPLHEEKKKSSSLLFIWTPWHTPPLYMHKPFQPLLPNSVVAKMTNGFVLLEVLLLHYKQILEVQKSRSHTYLVHCIIESLKVQLCHWPVNCHKIIMWECNIFSLFENDFNPHKYFRFKIAIQCPIVYINLILTKFT